MDHSYQCVRLARKCAQMNITDRNEEPSAELVRKEANSYLETMPFVCICPAIVTVTVQTPYGTDTMTVQVARTDAIDVLNQVENCHLRTCGEHAETGECSHAVPVVTDQSILDLWR